MPYNDPALEGLKDILMMFMGAMSVFGLVFILLNLYLKWPSKYGVGAVLIYIVSVLVFLRSELGFILASESLSEIALFPVSPLIVGGLIAYVFGFLVGELAPGRKKR